MSAKRNVTPRGVCPACGKKGLGNVYPHPGGGTYRQCVYCNEADRRPGLNGSINESGQWS